MSEKIIDSNSKLKEFLTKNTDLTFLIGAGCSIDPPSRLAAGGQMMRAILEYVCPETEIERIPDIMEHLRFEELVEIVRNYLDSDLHLIDYYGACNKPNLQHFYLAEMVKKGRYVMTTNFDFLIEHALLQSQVPKEEIVPVITEDDYVKCQDPNIVKQKGKKAVYKIHGSTENIITGEDTRKSLITTIAALNRVPKARGPTPFILQEYGGVVPYEEDRRAAEFENLFQLERHKRPLFKNITKNRTLVVIGYSGSDDFDIVPTLRMLENLKNIIWLKYKHDNDGTAQIHEVMSEEQGSNKIDATLIDLKGKNVADHVYRVEVNTSRFIPSLLDSKPTLSPENFTTKPAEWLQNHVDTPGELLQFLIVGNIYEELEKYPEALRCAQQMYRIIYPEGTETVGLKRDKALILRRLGELQYRLENYSKALDMFNYAIKLMRVLRWPDNQGLEVPIYNWLGKTYIKLGDLRKASECLSEAHAHNWASEEAGSMFTNSVWLAATRENMGIVNFKKKKYKKAIRYLEEALDLYEAMGDPEGKFSVFYYLGMVYYAKGNHSEALKWFIPAMQIAQLLELQDSQEVRNMNKYLEKIKGDGA